MHCDTNYTMMLAIASAYYTIMLPIILSKISQNFTSLLLIHLLFLCYPLILNVQ